MQSLQLSIWLKIWNKQAKGDKSLCHVSKFSVILFGGNAAVEIGLISILTLILFEEGRSIST